MTSTRSPSKLPGALPRHRQICDAIPNGLCALVFRQMSRNSSYVFDLGVAPGVFAATLLTLCGHEAGRQL
jgi:hypothetical protein